MVQIQTKKKPFAKTRLYCWGHVVGSSWSEKLKCTILLNGVTGEVEPGSTYRVDHPDAFLFECLSYYS